MRDKNTIVIDRSKWICGRPDVCSGKNTHGEGETFLLNEEGFMCCLGFATHQIARCSKDRLCGMYRPLDYYSFIFPDSEGKYKLIDIEQEAVMINDDESLTRKTREKKLKTLFKKIGLKLVFKGEYNN